MRDPDRIDVVITNIVNIWEKNSDLRLGQLLLNVVRDPMLYYIEDNDLVKALNEYYLPKE